MMPPMGPVPITTMRMVFRPSFSCSVSEVRYLFRTVIAANSGESRDEPESGISEEVRIPAHAARTDPREDIESVEARQLV
jgi:hypothetical protein